MASLFRRPSSDKWYIAFRKDVDGKKKLVKMSTGTANEARAREILAQVDAVLEERANRVALAALMASAGVDVRAGTPIEQLDGLFVDIAEMGDRNEWSRHQRGQVNALRQFLSWVCAQHPEIALVEEVRPRLAGEYWRHLADNGDAPNTRNNKLSALALVWKVVCLELDLIINPWEMVRRDQGGSCRLRSLTMEQMRRLLKEAEQMESALDARFWPGAIRLAFYTGLRQGDICCLETDEIREDAGCLILRPNKTKRWGEDHQVVHPLAAPWLEWVPIVEAGYVWPMAARAYRQDKKLLAQEWRRLCRRAEIKTERKPRRSERRQRDVKLVTFHSLRHTFVTMALDAQASRDDVQKVGGWKSVSVMTRYDHTVALAAAQRILEKMPDLETKSPAAS